MKYRNQIECEIDIHFVDQDKARAFFIESDWKESFYEFSDLEDAAEHLAINFHNAQERLQNGLTRTIEGFGEYVYSREKAQWQLTDAYVPEGEQLPCGDIIIRYETQLHCSQVEELHA